MKYCYSYMSAKHIPLLDRSCLAEQDLPFIYYRPHQHRFVKPTICIFSILQKLLSLGDIKECLLMIYMFIDQLLCLLPWGTNASGINFMKHHNASVESFMMLLRYFKPIIKHQKPS